MPWSIGQLLSPYKASDRLSKTETLTFATPSVVRNVHVYVSTASVNALFPFFRRRAITHSKCRAFACNAIKDLLSELQMTRFIGIRLRNDCARRDEHLSYWPCTIHAFPRLLANWSMNRLIDNYSCRFEGYFESRSRSFFILFQGK